MKKPHPLSLRTLLTTAALSLAASSAWAFSHPATIQIDGRRVASDVPPVVTASRQYLPLRAVTAQLGGHISYDKKTRAIVVVRGTDRLKLHLGKQTAIFNGKPMHLTHAPFAVRGRTMVAAHTIERALGPKVQYNPRKSTIDVVTATADVPTVEGKDDSASAF